MQSSGITTDPPWRSDIDLGSIIMFASQLHFRTLYSFLLVAEELNFSRAAHRLNIAQPALSQQIKLLEDRLGVVLFERTVRPLKLTEAGEYFRAEVQQLMLNFNHAVLTTKQIADGQKRWIGIGFTRSSMYSILPKVLSNFSTSYPDVKLNLYEMLTEQQPDALREKTIHIGIARDPQESDGITREVLVDEELVVALPLHHPLAAQSSVALRDLANEPFILFPKDARATFPRHVVSFCARAGFSPQIAHRALEIQTALGLVTAGLGVTLVAASVATQPRADLVFRPLLSSCPPVKSSLVVQFREGDESDLVTAMREIVRNECNRLSCSL